MISSFFPLLHKTAIVNPSFSPSPLSQVVEVQDVARNGLYFSSCLSLTYVLEQGMHCTKRQIKELVSPFELSWIAESKFITSCLRTRIRVEARNNITKLEKGNIAQKTYIVAYSIQNHTSNLATQLSNGLGHSCLTYSLK